MPAEIEIAKSPIRNITIVNVVEAVDVGFSQNLLATKKMQKGIIEGNLKDGENFAEVDNQETITTVDNSRWKTSNRCSSNRIKMQWK